MHSPRVPAHYLGSLTALLGAYKQASKELQAEKQTNLNDVDYVKAAILELRAPQPEPGAAEDDMIDASLLFPAVR
jgi:hypothetical protein